MSDKTVMTADDLLTFFQAHGLHIGDGFDPCSGTDHEAEEKAARVLDKTES